MTILKQPILFLFFNREDTTLQVFDEIRKYRPHKLFLASDGPRAFIEGEDEQINELRKKILELIDWPCEISQRFLDLNHGCKNAVSTAIDWFFENVEEGIILEDDCLPHPSFFDFCSLMLSKYKSDDRMMMITGTNYHLNMKGQVDSTYFFTRNFTIWGWATWKRAWSKYDRNISTLDKVKKEKGHFYPNPSFFNVSHLENIFNLVNEKKINTWDIQWEYSCLFNYGLCIVPHVNLISNIGVTGTHDNNESSSLFFPTYNIDNKNINHPELVYPNYIYENGILRKKHNKAVIIFTLKKVLRYIGVLKPLLFIKRRLLK